MPIIGSTRLRRHYFGRQAAFGTAIAAKRAYPYSGTPDTNLNWTDPEADVGSLYRVLPPTREAPDYTAGLSIPALFYNNIPQLMSAFFGDGVNAAGAGAAKTWTHQAAAMTAEPFDLWTYEFGDDADGTGGNPNDWFQLRDGILESFTLTGPETMGAMTGDTTWRFGAAFYEGATEADLQPVPAVPTAGLTVDDAGVPVMVGTASLFIDSLFGDIGETQIVDALHSFSINFSQELDQKRFANGEGFALTGYGRGPISIEVELQFAKTADTVGVGSESDAWFSETAVNRFVEIVFESPSVAQAGSPDVPYSWSLRMPLRYYTRAEGEIGNNTTITLTGQAFHSASLGYPFRSEVVNTLATASL